MGGGDGAKERRRLKRLQQKQEQEGNTGGGRDNSYGGANSQIPKNSFPPKNNNTYKRQPRHHHRKAAKPFVGNKNDKKFSSVTRKNKTDVTPTKKKSKKPKHLKRKIEQIQSDDVDEETKSKLLNELADWERKKTSYLERNNISVNKKPTTEVQLKQHHEESVPTPMDDDEEVVGEELDFPRSAPNEKEEIRKKKENKVENPPSESKEKENVMKEGSEQDGSFDDDSDDDKNEGGKITAASTKESRNEEAEDASSNKVASSDDDGSSDDDSDDDDQEEEQKRGQRGRRRRGRKDTALHIEESMEKVSEIEKKDKESKVGSDNDDAKDADDKASNKRKRRGDDTNDNRYCIGRKPVTDFVIGQKYDAKVVYVKPFGVFFDIGCHSDAFCHVSRLQDDFVKSPDSLLKEGDTTQARVVEINRREKRITVSLQSEARLQDEMASIEARTKRKEIRKKKSSGSSKKRKLEDPLHEEKGRDEPANTNFNRPSPSGWGKPQPRQVSEPFKQSIQSSSSMPKDESQMTPAELKRARKIARRAARREAAGADEAAS